VTLYPWGQAGVYSTMVNAREEYNKSDGLSSLFYEAMMLKQTV